MLGENFSESDVCDIESAARLFTCRFCEGGRILVRSLLSRESSKFLTSFRRQDISLVTLILTDTNARTFSFIFIICLLIIDQNAIDIFKQERERERERERDLSLRIFRLLFSSSLLYTQHFGGYVLRPSSSVSCRTPESTQCDKRNSLSNPRGVAIDCFNFINHDRVQVLSYSKYSKLFTCSWNWTCNLQREREREREREN